jgi:tRNA-splicing ligase RtcB
VVGACVVEGFASPRINGGSVHSTLIPITDRATRHTGVHMKQVTKRLMNWASIIDDQTLEQAKTASTMPFIFPHLALMPDAHLGKGATVGSVIPTLGAIIPAAVGVDIGCGMIAVRTQFTEDTFRAFFPDGLSELRTSIEDAVPLSAGKYNTRVLPSASDRVAQLEASAASRNVDPSAYAGSWRLQLGTLGSGNHFIEVSVDEENRVWLFLHSGSRGVGNKIAQHHIEVAQRYAAKNWIQLPDPDLAYLVEGTGEFDKYISELRWAQEFALLNREEMMARVIEQVERLTGETVSASETINCHHNYTERERHFGKDVWLSRKGAISAARGVPGLIPGSMGTASYVVVGKGNVPPVVSTRGRVRGKRSLTSSCGRPWSVSSTVTLRRSSTRSRRRTNPSTG